MTIVDDSNRNLNFSLISLKLIFSISGHLPLKRICLNNRTYDGNCSIPNCSFDKH